MYWKILKEINIGPESRQAKKAKKKNLWSQNLQNCYFELESKNFNFRFVRLLSAKIHFIIFISLFFMCRRLSLHKFYAIYFRMNIRPLWSNSNRHQAKFWNSREMEIEDLIMDWDDLSVQHKQEQKTKIHKHINSKVLVVSHTNIGYFY